MTAMQQSRSKPSALAVVSYGGIFPNLTTPPAFFDHGSIIIGRASVGEGLVIGQHAVIRADGHNVTAGDHLLMCERSTVHIAHDLYPTIIGNRVAIGRNAVVHACTVGDDCVIMDNAVILDGAVVEAGTILQPGAVVFPGKRLEGGKIYSGSPARPVGIATRNDVAAAREAMLREFQARGAANRKQLPKATLARDFPDNFFANNAFGRGTISLARDASVFFSCVVDAGKRQVSIGTETNIQDNSVIRARTRDVTIGSRTTLGHNVHVTDCSIGNSCLIGIGSRVNAGTVIEDNVLLAAGAVTKQDQRLSGGRIWAGNPARAIAELTRRHQEMMETTIAQYVKYAGEFKGT